jgi:hypothetical protein
VNSMALPHCDPVVLVVLRKQLHDMRYRNQDPMLRCLCMAMHARHEGGFMINHASRMHDFVWHCMHTMGGWFMVDYVSRTYACVWQCMRTRQKGGRGRRFRRPQGVAAQ